MIPHLPYSYLLLLRNSASLFLEYTLGFASFMLWHKQFPLPGMPSASNQPFNVLILSILQNPLTVPIPPGNFLYSHSILPSHYRIYKAVWPYLSYFCNFLLPLKAGKAVGMVSYPCMPHKTVKLIPEVFTAELLSCALGTAQGVRDTAVNKRYPLLWSLCSVGRDRQQMHKLMIVPGGNMCCEGK